MITDGQDVMGVRSDQSRPDERAERGSFVALTDRIRAASPEEAALQALQGFETANAELFTRVGDLRSHTEFGQTIRELINYYADQGEPLYRLLRGEPLK